MAHRSQSSSFGNVANDPNYIPPHYKEYYRIAIDVLAKEGIDAYYRFLAEEKEVDFLSSTEIEHINKHLKKPPIPLDELEFVGGAYDSDSSGTYWPVHTDIDAPALDLGWPNVHMCRGPSDVTIFVHPPAPDTLSIKEEARRLIRSATQVIAIVMDIFTDIDLFDEVLEAACRRIPVYLLLDELFSHHFLDMVKKCNVDLSHVHFLRVRTVAGSTYYCKSGMSFTGNLIERFMLVDCNAVLCGSYSFMWSFEKIHRSIVQRFQGELVAIFDEEFRILFAQSNPLPGVENSMPDMDNYYAVAPYQSSDRQQHKQNPGLMHQEDMLSQHSGYSWADSDPERFPHSFRQDDVRRQAQEGASVRGYMKQFTHFQQEKIQFDPTASAILRANRIEMNSYKRRSYAEGTLENYDARDHRYGRISDHYDQIDARSEHLYREKIHPLEPGMGKERFSSFNSKHLTGSQGILERFRQNRAGMYQYDESVEQPRQGYEPRNYEQMYLSGLPHHAPLANYEPCNSFKEIRHGSSDLELVSDGRLGQKIQKRPNIGQSYSCQKSPTQKQAVDPKMLFQELSLGRKSDDQPTKRGLRRLRIGSYLSTYQDGHPDLLEEGIPAPDEPQCNNELLQDSKKKPAPFETILFRDPPQITSYKRLDLYNSKFLRTDLFDGQSLSSDKGSEEREVKLAKHESIRSKFNPMLQRGSRLRSSLIFNSSKIEQHITQKGKTNLSIREQIQNEAKESEEMQEPTAAADLQENSSKQRLSNDQTNQIQHLVPANALPSETAKTSEPNPKEVFGVKSPDLDMSRQQSDSGLGSCVPDVHSSTLHRAMQKIDLQLSKKVQDVIKKMTQQTSLSREIKPPPVVQSEKIEKLTLEKSGKIIHSPPVQRSPQLSPQPCPQPSAQPCPQPSAQPCPQPSAQPCPQPSAQPGSQPSPQLNPKCSPQQGVRPSPQPGPQPSQPAAQKNATNPSEILRCSSVSNEVHKIPSSTSTLGEIYDNSAKVKLHSSAVCLDTRESKEDEAGGEPGVLNSIPKGLSGLKSFLNLPGDRKSKEMPSNIVSGQPPTSATENEKNPETTPKSDYREAVPSSSGKEEKPRRSPTNPTATKGAQTFQGSRYSTSTCNVLYSSNLRDDTKVILEQISANSQKNRAENAKVQHPTINEVDGPGGSTEHKVTPESDKTDSDKTQQCEVSTRFESLFKNKIKAQTSPDQTDPLIKRIESFRKERRVYSRFEVFYKKDDSLKAEDTSAGQQSDGTRDSKDIDGGDKKKPGKFIPKIFGTLRRF